VYCVTTLILAVSCCRVYILHNNYRWCTDDKNGVLIPGYSVEGTLAKKVSACNCQHCCSYAHWRHASLLLILSTLCHCIHCCNALCSCTHVQAHASQQLLSHIVHVRIVPGALLGHCQTALAFYNHVLAPETTF
jgi:Cft2 family RNA processing exonuclease